MITLSRRYAALALALLCVAALPVWYHAIAAPANDDCADATALFGARQLAGAAAATPSFRRAEVVESTRTLGHAVVRVRIARTLEPTEFYPAPVSYALDSQLYLHRAARRQLEVDGATLPVHWSASESGSFSRIEAYVFVRGGRAVWDLFGSGLSLALPQLREGTYPVTAIIVSVVGPLGSKELAGIADEALTSAWRQLAAACAF